MVFDTKSIGNNSPVFIHEEPIKQVCSYKYLGVYMDDLLTWGPHVDVFSCPPKVTLSTKTWEFMGFRIN